MLCIVYTRGCTLPLVLMMVLYIGHTTGWIPYTDAMHTVLHTSYHTPLPIVLALTYTARSATQHVVTHVTHVEERDASYPRSREYL